MLPRRGSELTWEPRFFDIKCRFAGFSPDAVVIVATIRALKMHGGLPKIRLTEENLAALEKGLANLAKHLENIRNFGLPAVVAVNNFPTDTRAEMDLLVERCRAMGAEVAVSEVWAKGGAGGVDLAQKVLAAMDKPNNFRFLYDVNLPIREKIAVIAKSVYGADGVVFTPSAAKTVDELTSLGYDKTPTA